MPQEEYESRESGSFPFFESFARELINKLATDPTPQAIEIVFEARRLLNQLQDCVNLGVADTRKSATIRELITLNRRALEYLVTKTTVPPPRQ